MAFTEFHYYSETLEIDVSVNVILPETRIMAQQEGKPLPTLYLLHGLSDDHTHWVRQTRLEFYARKYRLAIIMPCVNRSFYTDMKRGAKYFTFVSEELPRVMEMYFPLSSRRETALRRACPWAATARRSWAFACRKSTRLLPACPARWRWKTTTICARCGTATGCIRNC